MPRAGLSTAVVVDAALAVVDAGGPDALTLAAVAERSGVATPSLYKHIGGLLELRTLVGARILDELATVLTAAVVGLSGDDAVEALMRSSRAYVRDHPGRYAMVPADALHDPLSAKAGGRLLAVFLAVLRGCGLDGPAAIHATRRLRAILHGFCLLEEAGGFGLPEDLDETFQGLIEMFLASVRV